MLEKVTPAWLFCLSFDPNTPFSLFLAPLHTQHKQHKQHKMEMARTPTTIPMMLPVPEFDPEVYLCLSGWANSQENESTSRQKASLISAFEAFLGSIVERRLFVRVALGEADRVELSAFVSRLISFSSSIFSRVLLTASRMTGEGLVS